MIFYANDGTHLQDGAAKRGRRCAKGAEQVSKSKFNFRYNKVGKSKRTMGSDTPPHRD